MNTSKILKVLSHPRRRQILRALRKSRELCPTEIQEITQTDIQLVHVDLRDLMGADLVKRADHRFVPGEDMRRAPYVLNPGPSLKLAMAVLRIEAKPAMV